MLINEAGQTKSKGDLSDNEPDDLPNLPLQHDHPLLAEKGSKFSQSFTSKKLIGRLILGRSTLLNQSWRKHNPNEIGT